MFVEDAGPDVVVVEDDGEDHDVYGPERIDIDRRGLLDGLLGALLGVLDLISPVLGKTLDSVLKPVLGLLPAAEPDSANQFAMQASATARSNISLVEDNTAPPLSDGSRVVLRQTPVFDKASQSMRTFCMIFSTADNSPSPLLAVECSKANEASQRFGARLVPAISPHCTGLIPHPPLLCRGAQTGCPATTRSSPLQCRAMSLYRQSRSGSRPIPRRRCLTSRVRPCRLRLGPMTWLPLQPQPM